MNVKQSTMNIVFYHVTPFNHHYGYIGYEPIYEDTQKHRKYIGEMMERTKNAGKSECDTIYNESL